MTLEKCVYVVDKDPSARKGLARLVRTAGYNSREFASVDGFLDAIGSVKPGCLVLDAAMPGVSGKQLNDQIQACKIKMPVIVVTANVDSATRQKAQNLKAVGFFNKPVDGTALLNMIDWALQSGNLS